MIDHPIDGFTLSGGEPFYNPNALNTLVRALAEYNDDILIFTGYVIEELESMKNRSIEEVLHMCSVLIDGDYIDEKNNGIGLRGSSNQRCWVFKHQEKYIGIETEKRELQNIKCGDKVLTIGIPKRKVNYD